MRVLGVDPGLTRCGVAVVEGSLGRSVRLVEAGVLRTDADLPLERRLLELDQGLAQWIARHRPEALALERVFSQSNVTTVIGTAQASGIALLAAARAELAVGTYTPSEAKAAITGSGRADKAQVTAMVTRILGLESPPRPADAADALAVAIAHLWRGGAKSRLAAAVQGSPTVNRLALLHQTAGRQGQRAQWKGSR